MTDKLPELQLSSLTLANMAAIQQTPHDSELDVLFPSPSPPPTVFSPSRYPGASPDAVAALRYVMKDNYIKHHMFINDIQWHNHINYYVLGLYALGASGSSIKQYYKRYNAIQRPAIDPPEAITKENFIEHLGFMSRTEPSSSRLSRKGASVPHSMNIFSQRSITLKKDGTHPLNQRCWTALLGV